MAKNLRVICLEVFVEVGILAALIVVCSLVVSPAHFHEGWADLRYAWRSFWVEMCAMAIVAGLISWWVRLAVPKDVNRIIRMGCGFFVLFLWIAVLACFVRARSSAAENACINNLRWIDSARQQWALENPTLAHIVPQGSDLFPDLVHAGPNYTDDLPCCPFDPNQSFATSYSINAVDARPTCKIMPSTHVLP